MNSVIKMYLKINHHIDIEIVLKSLRSASLNLILFWTLMQTEIFLRFLFKSRPFCRRARSSFHQK